MSISVVIATSAPSEDLDACLRGLCEQAMPPEEVIVAGRLDSDELEAYLSDWRESHRPEFGTSGVTVGECGLLAALNAGREHARSTIVCFTSDRCVPEKSWLARIAGNFDHPLTAAAGGPVVGLDEEITRAADSIRWGDLTWWGARTDNTDRVPGGKLNVRALSRDNMAFRRHLVRDFDRNQRSENGLEEDICLGMIAMGFRVVCDPEALVRRRRRGPEEIQPQVHSALIVNAHHDNTYVFLKHAPLLRKLVFLLYTFLVGDEDFPGLLRRPSRKSPKMGPISQTLLGLKGKLLGLGTYFRHLRRRPRPHRH